MKLFELFEQDSDSQTVVFTFGNMNPPHAGHLGLVKFAQDTAKKNNADWHIFLSESAGVMTPDQKVAWLTAWCQAAGIDARGHIHHVQRIHQSAIDLYQQGFRKAIFVAGGKTDDDLDKSDYEKYWPLINNSNEYNRANVDPQDPKYFLFEPLTGRENKPSEGGAGRITSGTAVRTAAEQTLSGDAGAVKAFWQAASAGDVKLARKIASLNIGGETYLQAIQKGLTSGAKVKRPGAKKAVKETVQQMSVDQLAQISDKALDDAYHYGRSSPGNTFGWQANLKSAEFAKKVIDADVTDIEKISDAIHRGWNVTARAFVLNPNQFDDTDKLRAAGKLDAKIQQRTKLMSINYADLPDDEKEKDRVVARAVLGAMTGDRTVAEEKQVWDKPNPVKDHKHLSAKDKAAARARAKRAGRKYPNLVDNIWAARR